MAEKEAKSPQRKKPSAAEAAERRQREIVGIVLIALGMLIGAYMFLFPEVWLGNAILTALFTLAGAVAYALPFLLIVLGVLSIRGGTKSETRGSAWVLLLGVLALLALVQTVRTSVVAELPYMEYIAGAKDDALQRAGGGIVGAILCYPVLKLGGSVLAYILYIAVIVASAIGVTGLSIRDLSARAAEKVGSAVDSLSERIEGRTERAAEHTERRGDEWNESRNFKAFDYDTGKMTEVTGEKLPKPKKLSKKKKAEFMDEIDGLVSMLPESGALTDRNGQSARPRRAVTPLKSDIWDRIEPTDDVPFPLEPAPKRKAGSAARTETPFAAEPVRNGADTTPYPPVLDDTEPPINEIPNFFGADAPVSGKKRTAAPDAAPVPTSRTAATRVRGTRAEDTPAPVAESLKPKKPAKEESVEELTVETIDPNAAQYRPPTFELLNPAAASYGRNSESPEEKARVLTETLESFHISARVTSWTVGPVLTRFELTPAPGVRVSRITSLSNDIALALAAPRVRIEAPIPGKSAVGIEIPNKNTIMVVLRDIVESKEFQSAKSPVTMALGKDISGNIVVADLGKMPHMLIAGATGSGKSVCINDIIISMVYKSSPKELKLVLIDPKVVELSVFNVLPHLLIPVVTEPKKAASALRWAVNEMMTRYKKFSELGARDYARYNELQETDETRLPKLVVVIDELADLMMVAPDDVEDSICRIAQLGRAAGIHLIVATQRPSADIITGLIKANIPSRCAFAVSSSIDSRIILDATGAEKLLGRGDMLFHPNGAGKPTRLQCAYVSDEEVERIVEHFRSSAPAPTFDEEVVRNLDDSAAGGPKGGVFGEGKQEDDLLGEAVRIVLESGQASISMIQRRLRVGYARAARLVDIMETHGYVSGFDGSKPRKVLITRAQFAEVFGGELPLADEKEPAETPATEEPEA